MISDLSDYMWLNCKIWHATKSRAYYFAWRSSRSGVPCQRWNTRTEWLVLCENVPKNMKSKLFMRSLRFNLCPKPSSYLNLLAAQATSGLFFAANPPQKQCKQERTHTNKHKCEFFGNPSVRRFLEMISIKECSFLLGRWMGFVWCLSVISCRKTDVPGRCWGPWSFFWAG